MNRRPDRCRRLRGGWTLVELLVVVAIIAVLAAALFAVASKARKYAHGASCSNNMRQVWTMVVTYTTDNNDALPGPLWTGQRAVLSSDDRQLTRRLFPYLGGTQWKNGDLIPEFKCPGWYGITPQQTGPCLFMQNRVRLSTGNANPWGYRNSDSSVNTGPLRLSRVLSDCQGPLPWAITEIDKLHPGVGASAGWYSELPEGMAHGTYRNAVWFDGRIGRVNQENEAF